MNNLSPFKWFCLQNFPFIEADFDALTNYELMCKIVEYVNQIATKTNELGTEVQSLATEIIALYNWFENLDVQEEINNKLDEMVESGELASIINRGYIFASSYPVTTKAEIQEMLSQIDETGRTLFIDTDVDLLGEDYEVTNLYIKGDKQHKITNGGKITAENVSIEDAIIEDMVDEIEINGGLLLQVKDSSFKNWKYAVFNASSNLENKMYFNVTGNHFEDIGKENDTANAMIGCVIVPNGTGIVSHNVFKNIGQTNYVTNTKVVYLGKAPTYTRAEISESPGTRQKSMEVINTIVDGNIFDTIDNADGVDLTTGNLDEVAPTNAINMRCDNSIISNNVIKNINGFGQDREAIYTKSNNTQIINNTIVAGGTGEGAICCKPYAKPDYDNEENEDGLIYYDNYNVISGNNITGYCPVAIKNWGYGSIDHNNIDIDGDSYVQARMTTGDHYETNSEKVLNVTNNKVRVQKITSYTKSYELAGGTTVTYTDNDTANYNSMPFRFENYKDGDTLNMENNDITLIDLNEAIQIRPDGNPTNQVINIRNNNINCVNSSYKTNIIYFYSTSSIFNNSAKKSSYKVSIANNNLKGRVLNVIRYDYGNNADDSRIDIEKNNTYSLNCLFYAQQVSLTNNTASTQETLVNIVGNSSELESTNSSLSGRIYAHASNETANIIDNTIYGTNANILYGIQTDVTKKITLKGNNILNPNNTGYLVTSSGTKTISFLYVIGNFSNNIEVPFASGVKTTICYFIGNNIINTTADEQSEIGGTHATLVYQNNWLGIRSYS